MPDETSPNNPANQAAAAAAADAVNPNGETQTAAVQSMTYIEAQSPGDRMFGKQPAQRPGLAEFDRGLEQAMAAKAQQEAAKKAAAGFPADDGEGEGAPSEQPASAQPQTPFKLTDPPVARSQRSNFRKLEAARQADAQTWQAEKTELLKQIETYKTSAPTQQPEAVAAMAKELDGLKAELALLDVSRSPEFQSRFEKPKQITIQRAKNIAGAKAADVEAVLNMPMGAMRDAKLEELLKDLPPSSAAIVEAANKHIATIEFGREIELETARVTAGDRVKEREQAQARAQAVRASEFDNLVKEWVSGGVEALDASKDKKAVARIAEARGYFNPNNLAPREQAAVALQAALVPVLMDENTSLAAENQRLAARLARYESSLPSDTSTAPDSDYQPPRADTPEARKATFERGLEKALRSDPTFKDLRRARLY